MVGGDGVPTGAMRGCCWCWGWIKVDDGMDVVTGGDGQRPSLADVASCLVQSSNGRNRSVKFPGTGMESDVDSITSSVASDEEGESNSGTGETRAAVRASIALDVVVVVVGGLTGEWR